MSTRPPATRHDEIIAAVAELSAEMRWLRSEVAAQTAKISAVDATVNGKGGHAEQINNWRRDGKWLAMALTALGAFGSFVLSELAQHWPWG